MPVNFVVPAFMCVSQGQKSPSYTSRPDNNPCFVCVKA